MEGTFFRGSSLEDTSLCQGHLFRNVRSMHIIHKSESYLSFSIPVRYLPSDLIPDSSLFASPRSLPTA